MSKQPSGFTVAPYAPEECTVIPLPKQIVYLIIAAGNVWAITLGYFLGVWQ